MRKIYLASDSKARRRLLEIFGMKFKVVSSGVSERTRTGKSSVAGLVKNNARRKAEAACKKVSSGIIIAADTVVACDGRLFGKPKDLPDARRMLKRISRKPQWIYTGVCVLDKDNGRSKVSFEKTKIYMDSLSDAEISAYFRQVSPLDKAGSFDIQGKGAFFIRRIEGCFYNVVGLPVRILYRMLKGMGIRVFKILLVTFCIFELVTLTSGCSTEYNIVTGKEEAYYYSTEKEVNIGRNMAEQLEKTFKPVEDPLIQERVENIGKKIVPFVDRKDIDYSFKVVEEEEVNAISLPGGFIYVFKGLVDRCENDDELAAVIAHEIAHVVARHSIKKLQAIMGYSLARILSIPARTTGETVYAADLAFTEILLGYTREDELLADELSARYTKAAGYDPHGMIVFLEKLQERERKKPLRPKNYLKTHPYVPDRIRVVKQELGEPITFTDYINIEQQEHGQ